MHCLKWDTPYTLLNGEAPDISHLKVFGCGAYVHIPKETCANGLAPKSELMAYLGHTEGIKVFKFMCLSNNTLYHSTTVLFDETLFPKCSTPGKKRGTTRIGQPHASQLPIEPVKDTTSSDYDLSTPRTHKREEPVLDQAPKDEIDDTAPAPPISEDCGMQDNHPGTGLSSPPPMLEPVPLRRSTQMRKVPTHPGNVYGDDRHPTEVEKDIEQTRTWKDMVNKLDSSHIKPVPPSVIPGGFSNGPESEDPQIDSEGNVDELLCLVREGGVEFLNQLLAKAVPSDLETPDTANVRE